MSETVISVPEVHCDHCVKSIETAVSELPGTNSVQVRLETKDVAVDYDQSHLELEQIVAAIEAQGYSVEPPSP